MNDNASFCEHRITKKEASTSIQNINSNLNKLFTYIFCMECEAFQSKILWTCKCNKE